MKFVICQLPLEHFQMPVKLQSSNLFLRKTKKLTHLTTDLFLCYHTNYNFLPQAVLSTFNYFLCLGTTIKIRLFCPFCVILAIFIFSPYIKVMVLFIFCIKYSFYSLFKYNLFIYLFFNQELKAL